MEQNHANTAAEAPYDFRQYDQIWQRVAPSLSPYPGGLDGMGQRGMSPMARQETPPSTPSTPSAPSIPSTPSTPSTPSVPTTPTTPSAPSTPSVPSTPSTPEGDLPGAVENPCCMGTAAMDDLSVVEGFIEVELSDRRYYQAFARQAPSGARATLRRICQESEDHARRLMAAYYLITGICYHPAVSCERICVGAYCPALRERYHQETCNWMNYVRAAEGTTDPCLAKLLQDLGAEELRQGELLSDLLRQALGSPCGNGRRGV